MTGTHRPVDQDVRERIVHDLDTSFAVEAGAGTGKTSLLTARIVEAARTGRARLSETVAITFTERAAAELKIRLRDELERLCAQATGTEAERLRQALADLDTAHVSTIHSFAAALLRERTPIEQDPRVDRLHGRAGDWPGHSPEQDRRRRTPSRRAGRSHPRRHPELRTLWRTPPPLCQT